MCCDTPPFLEKDIPMLRFLFCLRRGGGVEEGLVATDAFFGSLESKVSLAKYPYRLVWAHRLYRIWHRRLLSAMSPSLQWYSPSLGAKKMEKGSMAPVIRGCILHPLGSRP